MQEAAYCLGSNFRSEVIQRRLLEQAYRGKWKANESRSEEILLVASIILLVKEIRGSPGAPPAALRNKVMVEGEPRRSY